MLTATWLLPIALMPGTSLEWAWQISASPSDFSLFLPTRLLPFINFPLLSSPAGMTLFRLLIQHLHREHTQLPSVSTDFVSFTSIRITLALKYLPYCLCIMRNFPDLTSTSTSMLHFLTPPQVASPASLPHHHLDHRSSRIFCSHN
jgi:hypothetical protein